ncbi:hypothetical protein IP70_15710 [alpha proteobacterium AAP38]|nr:hypothetical protein IP70_15710 [alpha proteobacterium AAP38]
MAAVLPANLDGKVSPPAAFTDLEKRVWREELDSLRALGFVEPADLGLFTLYCQVKARRDRLKEKLGDALTYTTGTGFERLKEEAKVMFAAEKQMASLQKQLGFGAGARLPAQIRHHSLQREFDFVAAPVATKAEAPAGKKAQAQEAAHSAGQGTGWGADLAFRGATVQ